MAYYPCTRCYDTGSIPDPNRRWWQFWKMIVCPRCKGSGIEPPPAREFWALSEPVSQHDICIDIKGIRGRGCTTTAVAIGRMLAANGSVVSYQTGDRNRDACLLKLHESDSELEMDGPRSVLITDAMRDAESESRVASEPWPSSPPPPPRKFDLCPHCHRAIP